MRGHLNPRLLVLPVALPAFLFAVFAVVEDFQDTPGRHKIGWAVRRHINDGLPVRFWRLHYAYENSVVKFRQLSSVDLMGNEAACAESPEQIVQSPALLVGIGQYVRKSTAPVGFFNQFTGKEIAILG